MKIKCPACGSENYFTGLENKGSRFCSECHAPLNKIIVRKEKHSNTKGYNQKPNCNTYDEAEETANKAWQKVKEAVKEPKASELKQAMKDYCNAVELVMKIWPKVVKELGIEVTTSTAIAYSAGYCEATKEYGLPQNLACLRGDHVAAKTLYKVSHWIPFK